MTENKLLRDLEEILNGSIDPVMFPYKKGNSLRIGKYAVRNSRGYYKVFDCETNKQVAQMFCKSSAVALAKSLAQGHNSLESIKHIDQHIQKWYNDCVFYKHTITTTKNKILKDTVQTRLDLAKNDINLAKKELYKIIFDVDKYF